MKKYSLLTVLFMGMAVFNISFAKVERAVLLAQIETVTIADLGIEDSGLLPTNPFYFFKEWGRSLQRLATRNFVAKAELELKIVNQKAAELKKVEELNGGNAGAIENAIRNYRDNQERLKERFSNLEKTSQNPNVEKLLSDLADRAVKHEKLLDSLTKKFSDNQKIKDLTESAKGLLEQTVATASTKDDPEKFAEKIKTALEETKGGELKNAYSAEIVSRIKKKTDVGTKNELEKIQAEFSDRAREDIEKIIKEKSVSELESVLNELPPSLKKEEIGVKIFQKQKEELNAKTSIPLSIPRSSRAEIKAEIAVCDQIKINLNEVWDLFKSGKITEQEYSGKYEILKKQFAVCEVASQVITSTTTAPVESGGVVVCTQQYDPVCGEIVSPCFKSPCPSSEEKTYPNECVAKASRGNVIKYKGECGAPIKEPSAITPLAPASTIVQ